MIPARARSSTRNYGGALLGRCKVRAASATSQTDQRFVVRGPLGTRTCAVSHVRMEPGTAT